MYVVPFYYSDMVKSIECIGKRRLKVILLEGYEYEGNSEYIVERYALFRSFSFIKRI